MFGERDFVCLLGSIVVRLGDVRASTQLRLASGISWTKYHHSELR